MRFTPRTLTIIACTVLLLAASVAAVVYRAQPRSLLHAGVIGDVPMATTSATTTLAHARSRKSDGAICRLDTSATTTAFVAGETLHLVRETAGTSTPRRHLLVDAGTLYDWRTGSDSGETRALTDAKFDTPTSFGTSSATSSTTVPDPFEQRVWRRDAITTFVDAYITECLSASITEALRTPPPIMFDTDQPAPPQVSTENTKAATSSSKRQATSTGESER